MEHQEATYKGRHIVIDPRNDEAKVVIDGESVPVEYVEETGEYIATQHSPYMSHRSLEELARHVVDHVVSQRSE